MNPRQRRGVLLLVLAGVGAVLVFALVSGYVADVREEVEPKTTVLVLNRDVAPFQPIPPDAIARKEVPQKYVSARAIREPLAIGNRVPPTTLPRGTELQEGMLVDPPELEPGQQEVSILISADTGVAGKLAPGDLVDVNATFAGDERNVPTARKIITRARIVTVGIPRPAAAAAFGEAPDGQGGADPAGEVVPVTFALSPRDVLRINYAETFAQEIRLSLIRPDDDTVVAGEDRQYTLPQSRQTPPPTP
jgi:pilus assembly protein CpaB